MRQSIHPGYAEESWSYPTGGNPDSPRHNDFSQNSFIDFFEEIVSVREWRKDAWNPCNHYKVKRGTPGSTWHYREWRTPKTGSQGWDTTRTVVEPDWNYCGAGTFGTWSMPIQGLNPLTDATGHSAAIAADLSSLIMRSLNAMLPGIRPRLSLLNSIYELKDFRLLTKSAAKASDTAKKVRSFLQRASLPRGLKSLRAVERWAADNYLQWQFNLKPLWSDINGLFQAYHSWRSELQQLVSNQGKRLCRHYGCGIYGTYPSSDTTSSFAGWGSDITVSIRRRTSVPLAKFHATMEYSYRLPDMSSRARNVRAVLDGLGVNMNPSIIWNALPWTFVVDWVVGVSPFLDHLKSRNIEPVTCLYRYMYSLHVKREIVTTFRYDHPLGSSSDVQAMAVQEDAYIRAPYVPNIASWLTTSGINSKEFVLGGALIRSR